MVCFVVTFITQLRPLPVVVVLDLSPLFSVPTPPSLVRHPISPSFFLVHCLFYMIVLHYPLHSFPEAKLAPSVFVFLASRFRYPLLILRFSIFEVF